MIFSCDSERLYYEQHGPAAHRETRRVIDACLANDDRPCRGGECDEGTRCERHELTVVIAERYVRMRRSAFARLVEICRAYLRAAPHSAEESRLDEERHRYRESFRELATDRAMTIEFPGVPWRGRRA